MTSFGEKIFQNLFKMDTDDYFPSDDPAAEGTLEPAEVEDTQEILDTCLKKFASPDFIMEPEIFTQLKSYFQAGGNPEQVIDLLSRNYIAVAQMANLMAEWLILAGEEISDVQQRVENHLHDMILKTFDPKKADAIFAEEGVSKSFICCILLFIHTYLNLYFIGNTLLVGRAYRISYLEISYLSIGRRLS